MQITRRVLNGFPWLEGVESAHINPTTAGEKLLQRLLPDRAKDVAKQKQLALLQAILCSVSVHAQYTYASQQNTASDRRFSE